MMKSFMMSFFLWLAASPRTILAMVGVVERPTVPSVPTPKLPPAPPTPPEGRGPGSRSAAVPTPPESTIIVSKKRGKSYGGTDGRGVLEHDELTMYLIRRHVATLQRLRQWEQKQAQQLRDGIHHPGRLADANVNAEADQTGPIRLPSLYAGNLWRDW